MGIGGFVKKLAVGLGIALFSTFFLKGSAVGNLVFLVGIAIAGLFGTLFALYTPLVGILTGVTVNLWVFQLPLLYVWLIIDIIDFILHIPFVSRIIQALIGAVTLGLGFIIIEIIRAIPFVLKLAILYFFASAAFGGISIL